MLDTILLTALLLTLPLFSLISTFVNLRLLAPIVPNRDRVLLCVVLPLMTAVLQIPVFIAAAGLFTYGYISALLGLIASFPSIMILYFYLNKRSPDPKRTPLLDALTLTDLLLQGALGVYAAFQFVLSFFITFFTALASWFKAEAPTETTANPGQVLLPLAILIVLTALKILFSYLAYRAERKRRLLPPAKTEI